MAVIDVEDLRFHYEKTLEHWLERFEKHAAAIEQNFDARFARMWRLYLAGSARVVPRRQPAALAGRVPPRPRARAALDARTSVRGPALVERFDVLIVGGGPAGSTCARALERARPARGGARPEQLPARQGLRGLDHAADRGRARARPPRLRGKPRAPADPRLRGEPRRREERARHLPRGRELRHPALRVRRRPARAHRREAVPRRAAARARPRRQRVARERPVCAHRCWSAPAVTSARSRASSPARARRAIR